MKNTLINITALGLTGSALSTSAASTYGIVGQKAPELEIDYWIDADGKRTTFTLAQHPDQWVFLKCFQSWCPGCHSHGLPAVKKIFDALQDNPHITFAAIQTVFEGFDSNTIDKVRQTQLQYELPIPFGHDSGNDYQPPRTMLEYRTGGTPWMILINPQRQVVFNDYNIHADNAITFLNSETADLGSASS